ncbi:MAG: hypothetical protein ACTSQ9_02105 [Candidatus Hodarchaeales archaeon]
MFNVLLSLFLGDLSILEEKGFAKYWRNKVKITKNNLRVYFFIYLGIFMGIIILQLGSNFLSFEVIIVEFLIFLLSLRFVLYFFQSSLKNFKIKAELTGFFVLNELLVILNTSGSLKEAIRFIVQSNYPIYSDLFTDTMVYSHFGLSIESVLKEQLKKNTSDEIKRIFLNILDTWENGSEVAQLSNKTIINHISEQISEETNKIDTRGSLFSGLIFLSPPVIICFILLSNQMSILIGAIFISMMVGGSFLLRPDKGLTIFSNQSPFLPFYDTKTSEFLLILGEYLVGGLSFSKSFLKAFNIYLENSERFLTDSMINFIVSYKLGVINKLSINDEAFEGFFPPRTVQILSLIEKFSKSSSKYAGLKLLSIVEEINKTNSLIHMGKARVHATNFQNNVIQFFSIISLAIITGSNYIFQMLSKSLNLNQPLNTSIINFDFIFILLGITLCLLPLYTLNGNVFSQKKKFSGEIVQRLLKILLFLVLFFSTKNFFQNWF